MEITRIGRARNWLEKNYRKISFLPSKNWEDNNMVGKAKNFQIYVHTKYLGRETADKMWTNTQFY